LLTALLSNHLPATFHLSATIWTPDPRRIRLYSDVRMENPFLSLNHTPSRLRRLFSSWFRNNLPSTLRSDTQKKAKHNPSPSTRKHTHTHKLKKIIIHPNDKEKKNTQIPQRRKVKGKANQIATFISATWFGNELEKIYKSAYILYLRNCHCRHHHHRRRPRWGQKGRKEEKISFLQIEPKWRNGTKNHTHTHTPTDVEGKEVRKWEK
jgi:hypothetical protein